MSVAAKCVYFVVILSCLARVSHTQTDIPLFDTCGTANMQSFSTAGAPSTKITDSVVCDPSINGFLVDIFNGMSAISCDNVDSSGALGQTEFSVRMSCSGDENGGQGVTGSLQVSPNATSNGNAVSTTVTIPLGITKRNLPVVLDTSGITISGRTCTLSLYAELYAAIPGTEPTQCLVCENQYVTSTRQTCGLPPDDDDDDDIFDSIFSGWILVAFIDALAFAIYMLVRDENNKRVLRLIGKVEDAQDRVKTPASTNLLLRSEMDNEGDADQVTDDDVDDDADLLIPKQRPRFQELGGGKRRRRRRVRI